MRKPAPPLAAIFRSQLQGELLAQVILGPESLSVSALARALDAPVATVHREVQRLEAAGLLITTPLAGAKMVAPASGNPAVPPLRELLLVAFGPRQVVTQEFENIKGVDELWIFGSWAARYSGEDGRPPGDVDVLVVGAPDRDDVYDAADRASGRLRREVNPTVVTAARWADADEPFLAELKRRPMIRLHLLSHEEAL